MNWEWVKANWAILSFVATACVGAFSAWADTQTKIVTLEQAVVQQTVSIKEQKETREQVIRQDEQLKSIKESQKTQEQLLRDILQGQRELSRKVVR